MCIRDRGQRADEGEGGEGGDINLFPPCLPEIIYIPTKLVGQSNRLGKRMSSDMLADLFGALAGAPNLPAARCAASGQWRLFDKTVEGDRTGPGGAVELAQARTEALAECRACPELAPCRQWFDRLAPRHKPLGVIAGVIHVGRGRLATAPDTDQADPPPGRTVA